MKTYRSRYKLSLCRHVRLTASLCSSQLLPLPNDISIDPSEDYISNGDGQRVNNPFVSTRARFADKDRRDPHLIVLLFLCRSSAVATANGPHRANNSSSISTNPRGKHLLLASPNRSPFLPQPRESTAQAELPLRWLRSSRRERFRPPLPLLRIHR